MVKHAQFVDKLLTNCLSVFGHFVGLALKGLNNPLRFTRSHPEFYQVDVHKNLAKFTRKYLDQTLFLASLQDGTLLLKRHWKKFVEYFQTVASGHAED